jgi:SAM-dependent methyltransferase
MSTHPHSNSSLEFYQRNAATFVERTFAVNMEQLYAEFLPLVPKGGNILDAGCGSGRDSAYFQKRGFQVAAFDVSPEIAALASKLIAQPVRVMTFLDVEFRDEFDAVLACASLLHVAQTDMNNALERLTRSLRVGGVLYASFKYGSGERERGGRFFNDYDETKLGSLLAQHPTLKPVKIWQTADARPDHPEELWLNCICRRHN